MNSSEHHSALRPLRGGWAVLAQVLAFATVSAFVQVGAEIAGVSRHWAFGLGFVSGFAAIHLRPLLALEPRERPWRSFALHVALFTACTVTAVGLLGTRIFAPAP